ncbi:MAG TPA: hypothetical protein PK014_04395 [Thermoanaerobaculia bacterium]|nr:hypothetical protein [Thermoanaerobaculia bacterium]HUM29296.1 hypothetical protein [Thermoanaerobaculia bacterium]HXK67746.1 hypothetical protein [Thermoanaerobaculia bacterium]
MTRLNPCELEIDLFCNGIKIHESCNLESDARLFARTRAGLGSGLELMIPGDLKDIWMNVPVEEDFVQNTPYFLKKTSTGYIVWDSRENINYPVMIPPTPDWYNQKTYRGNPMSMVGVLQGTYLGIYIANSCMFWHPKVAMNCKFCTTGLNVGVNEIVNKDVEEVVEVCRTAKERSGVTFVHFNSGWQGGKGVEIVAPYIKAIREKVGLFTGVQLVPEPKETLWKYDWLIDLGANHFSFCYEFHNPQYFRDLLPGKEKYLSREAFFNAMEYTSRKLGKGKVSGEIIAGVEPLEDTLQAIDYITSVGAFPTVCIFRPVIGSDMEHYPTPSFEDMRKVYTHLYHSMRKNGLPMGIVPNIEVSLVVNPDDTRFLAPRTLSWHLYEWKLKIMKLAARPIISSVLRPSKAKTDLDSMEQYRPKE